MTIHTTASKPRLMDSPHGYGWIAIAIHWLTAVLILFLFGLGVYMVDLSYYDQWYHKAPALHISLGLVVLLLMLLRIVWRLGNPTPAELSEKSVQRIAAKLVKLGLYISIFVVIASGYLVTTAEGQPARMFDLVEFPVLVQLSAKHVDLAGELHEYFAWGIIALVVIHALAALYHHFVMRDTTLLRMLKPTGKSGL